MSAEIKLQAGQWYRDGQGDIVYCIGFNPCQDTTIRNYSWMCCTKDTHVRYYTGGGKFDQLKQCLKDIIEHLPDCDSFDWVPPKRPNAPDGWRWLEDEEKIQEGDRYWNKKLEVPNFLDSACVYVNCTCNKAKAVMPGIWGVLRKIEPPQPKCRPFTCSELDALRGKWIVFESGGGISEMQITWIRKYPNGKYTINSYGGDWLFGNAKFIHDGSPFGVIDDAS